MRASTHNKYITVNNIVAYLLFSIFGFLTGTANAFQPQQSTNSVIKNVLNDIITNPVPNILDMMNTIAKVPPPPPKSKSASPYILTWEGDVEAHIRQALEHRDPTTPYMVGVAGIPGSGKSTSAEILTANLQDVGCALLPADGYHYSKHHLEAQPNGIDLLWRRGAPDTFDAAALLHDLQSIRRGCSDDDECIWIPGFDHAAGDPTPAAHCFDPHQHRVVICEGLYLLHDADGFDAVRDLFDLTIFVDASVDQCMDRLKIRNQCIPGYTKEEIAHRVNVVDRVNAYTVHRSANRADLVVPSATSSGAAVGQ